MANVPDRLFTWLDVEAFLFRLVSEHQWPEWLQETDAYWDSLTLWVSQGTSREVVLDWLESAFGPGSLLGESRDTLLLDGEDEDGRSRALFVEVSDDPPGAWTRLPRWSERRTVRDIAKPLDPPKEPLPGEVPIVAFHSYKGGVGRTLHAVALTQVLSEQAPILLVDADLEAPGVTWMYASDGRKVDFSYEDFLALLHASRDGSPKLAINIARRFLQNQRTAENPGTFVLPARRSADVLGAPQIHPADLAGPGRSPYYLTESLAELARAIGAVAVVIDLRAGVSEISAPVLLDPRVQRVFVTTVSAQSLSGTEEVIAESMRRAPAAREEHPYPAAVVTQFHPTHTEAQLADLTAGITEALTAGWSRTQDDETSAEIAAALTFTPFAETLLGLPPSWEEVVSLVRSTGIVDLMRPLGETVAVDNDETGTVNSVPSNDAEHRRRDLSEFARTLAYAETTDVQEFLPIDSLRSLLSAHRTELPICVVAGSKGAGKTFTQLQMCYRGSWPEYGRAVGIGDVTIKSSLVPVLSSKHLGDAAQRRVTELLEDTKIGGGDTPATHLEIRDLIEDGLRKDLTERQWRQLWMTCLARSVGADADIESAEERLLEMSRSGHRIFLVDGLEDVLQDIYMDRTQQRALRVLLTDTLDWLRSVRGRPFGLIVFVRRDLVQAALPQNSAQFLARYGKYELSWDSKEAVRLAAWIAVKAGALGARSEESIVAASDEQLSELMIHVWGEKMGTSRSREARSRGWFEAALSDFNGRIQARDVATFIHQSAATSISDDRWPDRVLTPPAMRTALLACSRQKIREIGEESPEMRSVLGVLSGLPDHDRQVPMTRETSSLTADQLNLLEANGVVFREEDKYWIPEIFRHGLGFKATGRPRIVAVANLVRKRNNLD